MNWSTYEVTDRQLNSLMHYNDPITVPYGSLTANAGVEVYSIQGKLSAIYDANIGAIRKLNTENPVFTKMQNRDLMLYNDHLLNPDVNTVIVDGFFGTGKTSTLCSHLVPGLVAGMKKGQGGIPQAFISKPHIPHGTSYGHLPGDLLGEKTQHEFRSYFQYFDRFGQPFLADVLMGKKEQNGKPVAPMLHVMVFEYLRGRDIENGWVVLDEAQNTDIKEMATFITRLNDPAKGIILGDTTSIQIDRRGNTTERNGFTFAKETYVGTKYTGLVELQTVGHILRGKRARDMFHALNKKGA